MKRNYLLYIDDILRSIDKCKQFIDGYDFEKFKTDEKTISACVREIEVIGEATKQIPQEITSKYLDIPWSLMAKMRDKMIHWYFEVDEEIVWKVIKEQFPILKDNIYKMKQELNS
ncbi:MAG: hypothetical protein KN64_11880 [Sulfurovum sp. AS07-7]|nr:MAG: hypothetical protein KN64_11880 [Sulfurovum sp. AS07-7]